MIRRSLVLALAAALSPMAAHATDLLQVYEMARNGDPQLAVAESTRLVNREGQVQARAALLPQPTALSITAKLIARLRVRMGALQLRHAPARSRAHKPSLTGRNFPHYVHSVKSPRQQTSRSSLPTTT